MSKKCVKCGRENPDESLFCDNCGKKFEEKNCPYCNAKNNIKSKFCENCGKSLIKSDSPEKTENISVPTGDKVCPTCNTVNSGENIFCKECGENLENYKTGNWERIDPVSEEGSAEEQTGEIASEKICPACNTANSGDYIFCKECGEDLEGKKTENREKNDSLSSEPVSDKAGKEKTVPSKRRKIIGIVVVLIIAVGIAVCYFADRQKKFDEAMAMKTECISIGKEIQTIAQNIEDLRIKEQKLDKETTEISKELKKIAKYDKKKEEYTLFNRRNEAKFYEIRSRLVAKTDEHTRVTDEIKKKKKKLSAKKEDLKNKTENYNKFCNEKFGKIPDELKIN